MKANDGVSGTVDPRFAQVRSLLSDNLASGVEIGASLYVNHAGEDLVDIWGGWRDAEHTELWTDDTIVNVASATKTVASLAALMLVERGQLDVDAPVAQYWPEFATAGKEGVLVRHILGHTSGVPAWDPPFSFEDAYDVATSTRRLAAQAPWWQPGTIGAYHASTFGHLVSELVLRSSGRSLSSFIQSEIAGPLNADFRLGLTDEDLPRVATVYPAAGPPAPPSAADPDQDLRASIRRGSFGGTMVDEPLVLNSDRWRRSAFAGSSGHTNARGLGRTLAALAQGGQAYGIRLVSPETIEIIFREQWNSMDAYYQKPIRWGIGFALSSAAGNNRGPLPFLRPDDRTCYWYGTGGSLGLVDVENCLTIAYVMNRGQAGRAAQNGVYYRAIYDVLGLGA